MQLKVQGINDRVANLELQIKAIDTELTEISNGQLKKEQIEAFLIENFTKQNQALMQTLSKHDTEMKKYIDDTIVMGVTEGIKQYDAKAKENFLTKGDVAAAQPAAASQGPGGGDFFGFVGNLINKAISGAGAGGGGDVRANKILDIATTFVDEYDARIRLDFRKYLKDRFGLQIPTEVATEAVKSHVELAG